jgi:hypothetical protein
MLIVELKTLDELNAFAKSIIAASDDATSTWVFDKAASALACFPIYYVKLLKHPIPWDGHDAPARSKQMAVIRKERVDWCLEHVKSEGENYRFFCASVWGRFFFLEYGDALLFHLTFG